MQTILHQGKPGEGGHWLVLPDRFVRSYKGLGYGVRELVLRTDAELAQQAAFNEGVELAARLAEVKDQALAKNMRKLKDKYQRVRA